ncbi:MAG: hypothetical protein FJ096_00090 [Deltaproteobacteria bacterium]|nr:hypothetical protein [Deltaproteobacteria bacterium]
MSKKVNWAEMDKRVRNRRAVWTPDEQSAVEESLKKLPDSAERAESVGLLQPAVGGLGADDDDDDDAS